MSDNDLKNTALQIWKLANSRDHDDPVFIEAIAALTSPPAPSVGDAGVTEINLNDVMMQSIANAAAQSPWVPQEYCMNEIVSDCCSFLQASRDTTPAAALQLPEIQALKEALTMGIYVVHGEADAQAFLKIARKAIHALNGKKENQNDI
jgi:hypothetical protein